MPGMQLDWGTVGHSLIRRASSGFNGAWQLSAAAGRTRRATDSNLVGLERHADVAASPLPKPPRVRSTNGHRTANQGAGISLGESLAEDRPTAASSERPAGARWEWGCVGQVCCLYLWTMPL